MDALGPAISCYMSGFVTFNVQWEEAMPDGQQKILGNMAGAVITMDVGESLEVDEVRRRVVE